ncbi:MAG: hypothetical protein ACREQR_01055 [Candidatus Binataceae bacterium]
MKSTILLFLGILAFGPNALAAEGGTYVEGRNITAQLVPIPSPVPPKRIGSGANPAATLSGSEKAKVLEFVNTHLPPHWMPVPAYSVVESEQVDVGGGLSDLFVLLDISGRGYSNILVIYQQEDARNLDFSQVVNGWQMGHLKQMVRDLNGAGRDELIVPTELDWPPGSWTPTPATPSWPAVYHLVHGKYVEDSRDFPDYYDTEILPLLRKGYRRGEKLRKFRRGGEGSPGEKQNPSRSWARPDGGSRPSVSVDEQRRSSADAVRDSDLR